MKVLREHTYVIPQKLALHGGGGKRKGGQNCGDLAYSIRQSVLKLVRRRSTSILNWCVRAA